MAQRMRKLQSIQAPPDLGLENLESREVPAVVGGLDPSFGTGGKLTTNFLANDQANAVAIQPDGKIVAVGRGTANVDFAVARYNPDGSPDTTFGGGDGLFSFTFGLTDVATGVAIQPDGKIVVVGSTDVGGNNDFAVIRVLADGSGLDPAFGGGTGKVTIGFNLGGGNDDRATGVALQADGRIVVVGSVERVTAGDFDFGVARLKTDGTLDTTFDGDGKRQVFFDLGGTNEDKATAVAIQTDQLIVVAGYAVTAGTSADFAVARLKTDGSLDTTFDTDGRQTVNFSNDDRANAVAVRPDGRIVLAGSWDGGLADFAIAQLTTAGALDPTFGGGFHGAGSGKFNITFGTGTFGQEEFATGVAIQPDGKIVVVGRTDNNVNGGPNNFGIARVLADGSALDPSFDTDGKAQVDFGGDDRATAVALDPNGRIVVAGFTGAGDFALARLIGTVERGSRLAVGGSTNGTGLVFTPNPTTGQFATTPSATLTPFGATGGNVRVATGDVNGDGFDDTVLVTGPGGPVRVAVINGADNTTQLVAPFDPFGDPGFTGGGFVAVADFDNNGRAEFVVTPDQGGGPRVVIFSLPAGTTGTATLRANFFGIDDPNFRGGARAAAADVNGDAVADLAVAAGFLGGPRVSLYDGKTVFATPTRLLGDFFAFDGPDAVTLRNGVFVAAGDVNGDGFADLVFGGGPGGGPRVLTLSGQLLTTGGIAAAHATPVSNFFVAGDSANRGGVRLAVVDADGDNKADLVAGSGEDVPSRVRVYLGKNITTTAEPATFQDLDPFGTTLPGGVFVG
jgi:uncharacterized delta-60 repeat protein